jgi:hypothetical protein
VRGIFSLPFVYLPEKENLSCSTKLHLNAEVLERSVLLQGLAGWVYDEQPLLNNYGCVHKR